MAGNVAGAPLGSVVAWLSSGICWSLWVQSRLTRVLPGGYTSTVDEMGCGVFEPTRPRGTWRLTD